MGGEHCLADASAFSALVYEFAVARLPKNRRDAFLGQMGRDIHDKINTNSFQFFVHGTDEKGTRHLAAYPDVAKFNHDCRPKYVSS